MKKALHFGAGNIGRGFIGLLLNLSEYEVVFADIDQEIIAELNEYKSYRVSEVGDEKEKHYQVDNVRGILSNKTYQVAEEIKDADLITTAVGVNNLKYLAEVIAEGIKLRIAEAPNKKLNIIACENAVRATSKLKKEVYKFFTQEEEEKAEKQVGFVDSAVDRIVPPQENEDRLEVKVEPFKEWIVDKTQFKGKIPIIEGMTPSDNLLAFVERKIYTLNTGHAATAYLGFYYNYQYIHQAIKDEKIYDTVKSALEESGQSLVKLYDFDSKEHEQYIEKILKRFMNPALKDSVERVGREPMRKLSEEDRLVTPALRAVENDISPTGLSKSIAAALLFDVEADEQSQKMQKLIQEKGVEQALEEITTIKSESKLGRKILAKYKEMK
ncbi:D-mannitol 1-phosphate 5-dehydrogenase [Halanaerobium saccharolyticum]|uniref:Mannitol-1-phosphate 5-dehydrogenase n=1 Tax=Halanaerobium saccharolyticum TaxID=43595 RepID=A0A4R7Z0H2_9FIRM|nr:mannitol-1-phosphate 5-dehydrogenase [Halanaerobium saccharolyticum]RAK07764.1 D-mannitol 1-phosphate 5-dehydrogenase [Halanaerobium saccharolyticum]TDW03627.1 D-mannitol 1-phosphate 5-dehydrogenase [Halanaerobium saccharolyticum]TDX59466.1 D-mannitol 1-phosphate 5-dehydrogenase [Halanaerobium saccharolyticum]